MADKKYIGVERRSGSSLTRRQVTERPLPFGEVSLSGERRLKRDYEQGRGAGPIRPNSPRAAGATPHLHDIVEIKEHAPSIERRSMGAGRRSGDLARALETGESTIFQMGKGAMKSAGKLAKKTAKHGGKLGLIASAASGLYDMVNK